MDNYISDLLFKKRKMGYKVQKNTEKGKRESIKNSIVQNIQKVVGSGYDDLVKLGVLTQAQASSQIRSINTGFQNYIGKL